MPAVINPDIVTFPHYSPEALDRRVLEYLRRSPDAYPLKRINHELDLYNDLRSSIHSIDAQLFQLDTRKATLHVERERVGVVTQSSSDDEGFEAAISPSLYKKPGPRVLVEKVGVNVAEQRRVEAELEDVAANLKRLRNKQSVLSERARPLHFRLAAMRKLINSRMVSGRPLKVVPLPRIDKAPPLDKLHATVAELRVSLAAIEAAPLTPDIAKRRVRAWVEGLARAPYAHNALDRDGVIDLGQVAVGDTFQPDILGLVAFVCKDQLIAKCEAIIDQAAGNDGLSDEDRATRRRTISEKLIATERIAEAVAWAKLEAGEPVDLAPDSSATAILSLEAE